MNQPNQYQENQYQSPQSNVETTSPDEFGEVRIFGVSGRIGRVRYLAYSVGFMAITSILNAIFFIAAPFTAPEIANTSAGLLLLLATILSFLFAIQRSHDFNTTGWLSLITLIPFGMFVLLLIPGTVGENRFGKQPPPNSAGVTIVSILATFFFVIGMIGIIAAIAIPTYNAYIQQAQMMQP